MTEKIVERIVRDLHEYQNSSEFGRRVGGPKMPARRFKHRPGMAIQPGTPVRFNSDGSVDSSNLAVQYFMESTSFIRAQVISQKFYEVSIPDFMSVDKGTGGWQNEIITNATGIIGGTFAAGTGPADNAGPTNIPRVDVAIYPFRQRIKTWKGGYGYAIDEVNQALAANNFDLITARMKANRKLASLGLQDVAFLGLETDLTDFPGLYSNSGVTVNTSLITAPLSSYSNNPAAFQAFIAGLLAAYATNANYTATPDTFLVPYADFMGLGAATSASFPIGTMIKYMLTVFKELTGNEGFRILPSRYGMADRNAGFWNSNGTNRYVLYNSARLGVGSGDGLTVKMDVPIDYTLNPAMSADGFNWNGVAFLRFGGGQIYRIPEVLYLDYPAS
jgi:hypothetical protein